MCKVKRKIQMDGFLPLSKEELDFFNKKFYNFLEQPITKIQYYSIPAFNDFNELQCKTIQNGHEFWFRIKNIFAIAYLMDLFNMEI